MSTRKNSYYKNLEIDGYADHKAVNGIIAELISDWNIVIAPVTFEISPFVDGHEDVIHVDGAITGPSGAYTIITSTTSTRKEFHIRLSQTDQIVDVFLYSGSIDLCRIRFNLDGNIQYRKADGSFMVAGSYISDIWYHVAIDWSSGSNFELFIDTESVGTLTLTDVYSGTATSLRFEVNNGAEIYLDAFGLTHMGYSNYRNILDGVVGSKVVITDNIILNGELLSNQGGSGEVNTASNQGVGGVGVYDNKVDVDLQFRNIAPASNKVNIALNSKNIDIDVVDSEIDHNQTKNYDSAKHFTQTEIVSLGNVAAGDVKAIDNVGKIGSKADGDVFYYNGSLLNRLAKGTDGQVLKLNTGLPAWEDESAGAPQTLDALTDVNAPTPNDGDVLTFDDSSQEWQAIPPSGGGTDDQVASEVPATITNFDGVLSPTDDDVQKALDTLDDHSHAPDHTHSNKAVLDVITVAGSGSIMSTAERTKLSGIEDSAKADQNASEVPTTVSNFDKILSASDSNVQTALETLDEHNHSESKFSSVLATDHTYNGLILEIDVDEGLFGDALFMDTDGNYSKANATSSTLMPCSAIMVDSAIGTNKKVLLFGTIRDDSWAFILTGNRVVYVDPSAGGFTTTIPTTGNYVQAVGIALASNIMLFNPNYVTVKKS